MCMKKKSLLLLSAALICWQVNANAADLIEVYKQAQSCDAIFQQAIAQRLSTKEGVPISVSALLPNISLLATPTVSRYGYSGSNFTQVSSLTPGSTISPRNLTQRTYNLSLNLSQTVFNFADYATVASAVDLSKGADATLNAALQSLMIRVAKAYLTVLQDEDNLSYYESSKLFNAEQLDQVKQQYKVGLKTVTDVYTAQAQYDTAFASVIAAQTTLANDREALRVITGKYYPRLSSLSDDFPLVSPQPANVDEWVKTSLMHNWTIKQFQYNTESNKQIIKQQFAGHLPTMSIEGSLSRQYVENINGYRSFNVRNGPGTTTDRSIGLNIDVPIFQGGYVVAETNQATYNYQAAQQQLEQTVRNTVSQTRTSYLNVISGITKVDADKQAIKSNMSSLEGMQASYRVGTETLVDVLNQQQKLVLAQFQYAQDRYAFVNNILALKQAAGTLCFKDLLAINEWLTDKEKAPISRRSTREMSFKYPRLVMNKKATPQS